MDANLFQYALLPLSQSKEPAAWIVDDKHQNYQSVDILDFPQKLIAQVFILYEKTYKNYTEENEKQLISNSDGLLKYNRWILFQDAKKILDHLGKKDINQISD